MTLKKTFLPFFMFCVIAVSFLPLVSRAEQSGELTVVPIVIDGKAKARDILKETITITNTSARKLILYPSVNDVTPLEGQEAFVAAQSGADRKESLANWIELSRGVVELAPDETREIPFVIRVNLNALPDTYHADISFYEGSNREEAEAKQPLAVVTVNTEVQADIKESMQLNKFMTDGFFFSGDDILFNFQLENIGNQELKPKGEIRIYDRKGREVASVPVNPEGKSFTPEQAAQLASAWSAAEGFGKFKAFLNIDYGNNQSGSLQDTVYFWIIPWQQLLAIFVVSVIAIVVSALYFHRWLEHKHMQRFALAGLGAGTAAMQPPMGTIIPPKMKPVTAIMPETQKPAKKGFFSRFRRTKKADLVAEPAPVPPVASVAPTSVAAPAVVEESPTVIGHEEPARAAPATPGQQQSSHTIDLTATHAAQRVVRTVGHVINLKDGA